MCLSIYLSISWNSNLVHMCAVSFILITVSCKEKNFISRVINKNSETAMEYVCFNSKYPK